MKDDLTDEEHLEILNNSEANLFGKLATFKDYVKLGYEIEKAKSMAGLINYDFSADNELVKFINEQKNHLMISSNEKIKETNSYFKDFVLKNKDVLFDELIKKSIKKIESEKETDYSRNWENLIVLMQIIERVYNLKSIITEDNYFRFQFHNDEDIQDKGANKIDALYSCCYQTLKRYWKENNSNYETETEFFNINDVDKLDEDFNDEGLKENQTKDFLKALPDEELISFYNVVKINNPNKVKFLSWFESEIKSRKQ